MVQQVDTVSDYQVEKIYARYKAPLSTALTATRVKADPHQKQKQNKQKQPEVVTECLNWTEDELWR